MIFLELFYTFFIIGAFTVGGGYAMISLIEHQVLVVHGWISEAAFTDIIAISQMTPGPIGINSATYVGYSVIKAYGGGQLLCILGSATATFATVLPSFIIMLSIVKAYNKLKGNGRFKTVMEGLKYMVAGLIGAAALVLIFRVSFENGQFTVAVMEENFPDWKSWLIFAAAFIAAFRFKIHPIKILLCAALVGLLVY